MSMETAAASLAVTFVGHTTVLVELDGARILTDPLLRLRVGALAWHSPLPPASVYRDLDAVAPWSSRTRTSTTSTCHPCVTSTRTRRCSPRARRNG
jgi:hypothetical protein